MTFDMATDMCDMDDIVCKSIVGADDVNSHADPNTRRGVAGIYFMFKAAGAKADEGGDLDAVLAAAQLAKDNTRTVGFALTPCIIPEVGHPNFELAENERLKKDIRRLQAAAREKAQWSDTAERRKTGIDRTKVDNVKGWAPLQGAKSKKQMARAKAIEKRRDAAIEEKQGLLKNLEEVEALKLIQPPFYTDRLVELRALSVDYGAGALFAPLSHTLRTGDRVALIGPNGSGKSSVIKLICGGEIPHTGLCETASRLAISYVPQDTGFLRGDLKDLAREKGIDESLFKAILRKLDFSRVQFEKDMADYSAGQKKKVLLAASLCESAQLHIWDEPMNYIDVYSRMQLEELILQSRPPLLFVEHDRAFCDRVATAKIELVKSAESAAVTV